MVRLTSGERSFFKMAAQQRNSNRSRNVINIRDYRSERRMATRGGASGTKSVKRASTGSKGG
ncbi:hypothetical protein [Lactobacillus intestinalis]|uniref:hypothetical protein n=2 Tax=Lactobacillus intestinalis TaxID=151781 RepID=UPI00272EE440|nr:hypothetical protein [Lactobacillus intestinalis]